MNYDIKPNYHYSSLYPYMSDTSIIHKAIAKPNRLHKNKGYRVICANDMIYLVHMMNFNPRIYHISIYYTRNGSIGSNNLPYNFYSLYDVMRWIKKDKPFTPEIIKYTVQRIVS